MTKKYDILAKHKLIGLGYVSAHPHDPQRKVASIIPVEKSGSFRSDDMEIEFQNPLHEIGSASERDEDLLKTVLGEMATEWWKCDIVPATDR